MSTIILKAEKREALGREADALRQQGLIPAVIYGHKLENQNISLPEKDFWKVYAEAGTSTLVDLEIAGGKKAKAIITDIQRHPVKHNIIHVDLHQINMKEEMTAQVSLKFIGEAPAIKSVGGVLLTNLESVEVKCLPDDLPHEFTVDLSHLDKIDSHITVKDLVVPEGVKIMNHPDEFIAVIKAVKVEAEAPIVTEKEEVSKVEVSGAKKKEDEAAGEGDKKETKPANKK